MPWSCVYVGRFVLILNHKSELYNRHDCLVVDDIKRTKLNNMNNNKYQLSGYLVYMIATKRLSKREHTGTWGWIKWKCWSRSKIVLILGKKNSMDQQDQSTLFKIGAIMVWKTFLQFHSIQIEINLQVELLEQQCWGIWLH